MEEFLAERAPGVAFYSEDRGMVTPGRRARVVLIVDPIDGTRPAMAGFESACVSVAAAPLDSEPTIGDVEVGCVVEIKTGAHLRGRARRGDRARRRGSRRTPTCWRMFWAYGLRGRPVRESAEVLADVIDGSSVGGGTFDLGSATFDMTRIVTGQLDAYVEPGPRMVSDVPGMREEFERVGGGAVLNNSPYDLAAAATCSPRAGRSSPTRRGVRSTTGRSSAPDAPSSRCPASAPPTPSFIARIVAEIDAGIGRLRDRSA